MRRPTIEEVDALTERARFVRRRMETASADHRALCRRLKGVAAAKASRRAARIASLRATVVRMDADADKLKEIQDRLADDANATLERLGRDDRPAWPRMADAMLRLRREELRMRRAEDTLVRLAQKSFRRLTKAVRSIA